MKKIVVILVSLVFLLNGCATPRSLENKVYPTYGFFNESTDKSKNVCYKISVGNVIWSIILAETVIAPIYFIGFDLWEPVRLKKNKDDECTYDG